MDDAEIYRTIQGYLEDVSPSGGTRLDGSTDLLDGWFVDSIAIVDTVVFLERRFGIKIARADITADTFRNLDSLVGFVSARLQNREAS
jgi:acyl carrier protein